MCKFGQAQVSGVKRSANPMYFGNQNSRTNGHRSRSTTTDYSPEPAAHEPRRRDELSQPMSIKRAHPISLVGPSTALFQTEFFMHSYARTFSLSLILILAEGHGSQINAQTVWSGLTKSFTKLDGADGRLTENQDPLTPNVTIARDASEGIYNGTSEPNFLAGFSPEYTEWATSLVAGNEGQNIVATNWAQLSFTDWVNAYGGDSTDELPAALLGHNAVVHLTADNVYLDLKFTSWGQPGAGGFSYLRAEPSTGDYNHNHIVDAADYTVWRDTLGSTTKLTADGNADKIVNQLDYQFWKDRFGNHAGSGSGASANAAVPEPASALLFLMGLLAIGYRRRTVAS
jgi:hypothetical protein